MELNNKGFTLVELLGSMVILGLLIALVVPNIVKITENSTKQQYITDANKMIEAAKYKLSASKELRPSQTNGSCIYITLAYLDNSEFDESPYGGCYDVNKSFVKVTFNKHSYNYEVALYEKHDDDIFTGIDLTEENSLDYNKVDDADVSSIISMDYKNPIGLECPVFSSSIRDYGNDTDVKGLCAFD